jgi:hypothetical protein
VLFFLKLIFNHLIQISVDQATGNPAIFEATYVLAAIAQWLDGAQALVDAKVQDHILKLLKYRRSWGVPKYLCLLIQKLAGHELTAPAVLELNLLKQLVILSRQ